MQSFIPWIGGKNLLKKQIAALFPPKYDYYVEVFGGAGWVLFNEERKCKEVYNDINGELVNLFRVVKHHADALQSELSLSLKSREIFEDYRGKNLVGLTDIQRAARFYSLIKLSFGSKTETFAGATDSSSRINKPIEFLSEIQSRLEKVCIERKDFAEIIDYFNKKKESVLIYRDPPYVGTEDYYIKYYKADSDTLFTESEHLRLANALKNSSKKWILSYNDCEFVRETYRDFNIKAVERANNMSNGAETKKNKYKELIITNY